MKKSMKDIHRDHVLSNANEVEISYLAHYGIKGQKWGLRRYQNKDGTWTSEGRERYGDSGDKLTRSQKKEIKKEYNADNKKAFEYGKSATVSARAATIARKKEAKAQKKYDRKHTDKRKQKLKEAKQLRKNWDKVASENEKRAKDHFNKLSEKYGKEHVSGIKYDKKGRVNEKIHTKGDYAKAVGMSVLAGITANVSHSPVTVLFAPSTKNGMARSAYYYSKRAKSSKAGLNLAWDDRPIVTKSKYQKQLERDAQRYRQEHRYDYRR